MNSCAPEEIAADSVSSSNGRRQIKRVAASGRILKEKRQLHGNDNRPHHHQHR